MTPNLQLIKRMQFKKTRERHSEKDGMLKVFAGSAVKYISGDYSRSTIVDLQKQKPS